MPANFEHATVAIAEVVLRLGIVNEVIELHDPAAGRLPDRRPVDPRHRHRDLAIRSRPLVTDLELSLGVRVLVQAQDDDRQQSAHVQFLVLGEEGCGEPESHLVVCDQSGKNAKAIASEKGRTPPRLMFPGRLDWR